MKFSIRELLLLTLIVALAVGWWLDHHRREDTFHQMRDEINRRRKAEQQAAAIAARKARPELWELQNGKATRLTPETELNYIPSFRDLRRMPTSSAPAPVSPKD